MKFELKKRHGAMGRGNKVKNGEIRKLKAKIVPLLKQYGVRRAGFFGSIARGEARKESDIDILIEVKAKKFSLLDLIGLESELKKALRQDVDLLTYKGINPLLKDRILKEEVRII